jgi:DNA-binding transcriptional ArsR family regulator
MPGPVDALAVTSAQQYGAFAHPLRLRLLRALGERPATISQLAATLGTRKGNVAHHLRVLRDAGLVRVGFTRQVRGGTEQYYERVARRYELRGGPANEQSAIALGVVADEIAAAPADPYLTLRDLRLTQEQVDRLTRQLTSLLHALDEAPASERRYGVILGVWRRPLTPG